MFVGLILCVCLCVCASGGWILGAVQGCVSRPVQIQQISARQHAGPICF